MSSVHFVFHKNNKIKVLNREEAVELHENLLNNGWVHTATINAGSFIENLFNECEEEEIIDKINSFSKL